MKIKLTLTEFMLGTCSNNPDVYKEFLESRRTPDSAKQVVGEPQATEDETATLPVAEELAKAKTVFMRMPSDTPVKLPDGREVMYQPDKLFIYDYMIKGFFKDTCSALSRVPDTESSKLTAFRKIIDGLIFAKPRRIELHLPAGKTVSELTRPLRCETAQGPRVALACSEMVPEGTTLEFEIVMLDPNLEGVIHEWFDYGCLRGLGQWRNSGAGRFEWKRLDTHNPEKLKTMPVKKAKATA